MPRNNSVPPMFPLLEAVGDKVTFMGSDPHGFDYYLLDISGAGGDIFLRYNDKNRPLNTVWARKLANSILNEDWDFLADPLRILKDGTVGDGQHRAWALRYVMRNGGGDLDELRLPFLVVVGLDKEQMTKLDIGKNRTPRDVGAITGAEEYRVTYPALRVLGKFTGKFTTNPLGYELARFEEMYPFIVEVARHARRWNRGRTVKSTSMLTAVMTLCLEASSWDHVYDFYHQLVTGMGMGVSTPNTVIYAMRSRLLRELSIPSSERLRGELLMEYIIMAWNRYISGESRGGPILPRRRQRTDPTDPTSPRARPIRLKLKCIDKEVAKERAWLSHTATPPTPPRIFDGEGAFIDPKTPGAPQEKRANK